jgi:hypothetical protein
VTCRPLTTIPGMVLKLSRHNLGSQSRARVEVLLVRDSCSRSINRFIHLDHTLKTTSAYIGTRSQGATYQLVMHLYLFACESE